MVFSGNHAKSREITRTNLTNFPKNGLVGRMAQDCVDKIERKSFLVVHFLKKILDIYIYMWCPMLGP